MFGTKRAFACIATIASLSAEARAEDHDPGTGDGLAAVGHGDDAGDATGRLCSGRRDGHGEEEGEKEEPTLHDGRSERGENGRDGQLVVVPAVGNVVAKRSPSWSRAWVCRYARSPERRATR